MITTTTTTTVVIITTAKAAMAVGIIGVAVLIGLLIVRELTSAYASEESAKTYKSQRIKALGRNAIVAVVPLLLIFLLIVVVEVSGILTS